jgi:NADH-quinone oxidoreductase subunit N
MGNEFFAAELFQMGPEQWSALSPYLGLCVLAAITTVGAGCRWSRTLLRAISAIGFTAFAVVLAFRLPGATDESVFGTSLVLGPVSMSTGVVLGLMAAIASIFVVEEEHSEWAPLMVISVIGLSLLPAARDWIAFFVYLETLAIPGYVLAGLSLRRDAGFESGLKYLMTGAFSSGLMLMGLALLYGFAGSLDYAALQALITSQELETSGLLVGGFSLLAVSLAFKVALVPFHMWAPDVYQSAPASAAGFLATATKVSVFAATFVAYGQSGLFEIPVFRSLLVGAAVLSVIVGNLLALAQKKLRRMLAYSSIASAGYAGLAYGVGGEALFSVLCYLTLYGFSLLAAFAALEALALGLGKGSGSQLELRDLARVSHRGWAAPVLTLALFSLAGIPPLPGFLGKYLILRDLWSVGLTLESGVLVLGSLLGLAYYLRVLVPLYLESEGSEETSVGVIPGRRSAALGATLAIAALFAGLWGYVELNRVVEAGGGFLR